ncbi:MAG TPA: hypothetical protein VGH51_16630 [Candidatus Angelobacter sp.]|jgi:hypothetical protein
MLLDDGHRHDVEDRSGIGVFLVSAIRITRFYEKVIKVKADVAAIKINFGFALGGSRSMREQHRGRSRSGGLRKGAEPSCGGSRCFCGVGGTIPPRLSLWGNGKGARFLAAAGYCLAMTILHGFLLTQEYKHVC